MDGAKHMGLFKPDPRSQYHSTKTKDRALRIVFIPWAEGSDEAKEWKDKTEQWNLAKRGKFKIVYFDPRQKANADLAAANSDSKAVIYIRGHGSPGANSLKANVNDEQRSLAITEVCQRLIDMGLQPAFSGAIKFHSCYSATIYTDSAFDESHAAAQKTLEAARERKNFLTTKLPEEIEQARDSLATTQSGLEAEQQKWFWSRDNKKVEELTRAVDRRTGRVNDLVRQEGQLAGADGYIRERELRVPTRSSIAAQGAEYMRNKGFDRCSFFGYLGPMESLYTMDTSSVDQKETHKFVNLEKLEDAPGEVDQHLKQPDRVRASVARMKII